MRTRALQLTVVTGMVALSACDESAAPTGPWENAESRVAPAIGHAPLPWSVEDLLGLGVGPVAIAHRGMGENLGEDPDRPIENTIEAIRQGFETGASVVEADLQMTADGEIVLWHDDFLEDFTCINTLTMEELAARVPHIASFQALLQTAKRYNAMNPDRMTGLVTVDLKPASPLCDPNDVTGPAYVSSVIRIIRRMGASDLIYFNSMSPVLLGLAAQEAPEIPRQLTVLVLQLLSPEEVEAAVGLPVVLIEKNPDYGLQWAEIGAIFRLPGYSSPEQAIQTAFATSSAIISWDLQLLGLMEQTQPGSAAQLVQATQAAGIHAFSGDVSEPEHWFFGASLGVEALYANDVPLAVGLQPDLD